LFGGTGSLPVSGRLLYALDDGGMMKELNGQELEMVAGGASSGFLDSIGGALFGTLSGALGGITQGLSSLLGGNPIGAILNVTVGTIFGAISGLFNGLAQGTSSQLQSLGSLLGNPFSGNNSGSGNGPR
jgi:hypothetical protein